MSRKYELKKRLERQHETRRRIIDAVMALHEELGPARTTISAVAERAGVERLTVYRHFSDELSLLQACGSHFTSLHPLPQIEPLIAISDPEQRLKAGLASLFAYYSETEAMTENVQRDAVVIPALAQVMEGWYGLVRTLQDLLVEAWGVSGKRRRMMQAWIGHALEFSTWQSLVRRQGLTNAEAIHRLVAAASEIAGQDKRDPDKVEALTARAAAL